MNKFKSVFSFVVAMVVLSMFTYSVNAATVATGKPDGFYHNDLFILRFQND
jgi:hypothetical protein